MGLYVSETNKRSLELQNTVFRILYRPYVQYSKFLFARSDETEYHAQIMTMKMKNDDDHPVHHNVTQPTKHARIKRN